MTQKENQLLLKDLCARLPYGLKVKCEKYSFPVTVLYAGNINEVKFVETGGIEHICLIKPYLRPMSSMTDEEKEDLKKNYRFYFDDCDDGITNGIYSSQFNRTIYEMIDECDISDIIDWLNSHQFDYHWLIEKGLALEAPEGMYKI